MINIGDRQWQLNNIDKEDAKSNFVPVKLIFDFFNKKNIKFQNGRLKNIIQSICNKY